MRKSITKKQVIEALKKESLKPGSFFHGVAQFDGNMVYKKGCSVCAVGAILRHMSFETWAKKLNLKNLQLHNLGRTATNYRYNGDDISSLLEEGNYLGALSNYFEQIRGGRSKKQCIAFVKKYFPSKITLNIDKMDLEC